MESNYRSYEHVASFGRLQTILNQADVNYTEADSLPSRDKLTFSNGYYANCTAIFVDIRKSSGLPAKYKRPTLARLYRAYISEVVAIMNGNSQCREINIVGDGVWCVVDTPYKSYIDAAFNTTAAISSLIKVLNYKLKKKGIDEIQVGIGVDWGRALMIKAGYSGSGINDVVYMGDVVNRAAKLAAHGNETWADKTLMVGSNFRSNLKPENQDLLTWTSTRNCYHGNIVNTAMDAWYEANCP